MPFRLATVAGRAVLVSGDPAADLSGASWFDVERISGKAMSASVASLLADPSAVHELAARLSEHEPDGTVAGTLLGPPVPHPVNAFGIGLNYRAHAEESNMTIPSEPLTFSKQPTCITGPDATVELRTAAGDYEVELVVAIGPGGRDIDAADAWRHVAGLTVGQDISDRRLQFATTPPQFGLGKSRDGYGPTGPVLVSPDAVSDCNDLALWCTVNGEERQRSSTGDLIFDVPALVSYLSTILTLQPGDLIFTGTPAGVGATTMNFLKPGDVIVSGVDGIGTITTRCA
jgi:2,4-didehydro-3-deoxy-L-rhamnonate hydrolase